MLLSDLRVIILATLIYLSIYLNTHRHSVMDVMQWLETDLFIFIFGVIVIRFEEERNLRVDVSALVML